MKEFIKYRYSSLTLLLIVLAVLLFTKCINKNTGDAAEKGVIRNSRGEKFAGSATCAGCHKSIYATHLKTAHYLTSGIATKELIKGSFQPGQNIFTYDIGRTISMEERDSSFYQVEYDYSLEKGAHRFDIVVGSGTMGQSYLTWKNDQLFQLPVSYFGAAHQWSNSPGFPNKIVFSRFITSRCLECHATFAKTSSPPDIDPEKFDSTKMVYGVDCEKCHGPAAEHVAYQTQNPTATLAKYVINPARLSRQQNMNLCASCHGGRLFKNKPSFEFKVGDSLSNFFNLDTAPPDAGAIDVHGNQNGLLRASKCFRMSETLTCVTCHNTHEDEKGKAALYSQRCMTCHNDEHQNFCKMTAQLGPVIKNNCIDCHMPLKLSRKVAVFLPGSSAPTAAYIRSHLISIYPEETARVLSFMKKKH